MSIVIMHSIFDTEDRYSGNYQTSLITSVGGVCVSLFMIVSNTGL